MKRFNVINYNINRESIIDLPDIHHSLIIIPETLYENSDIISTNSDNKSTIVVPTFKIEEEEEEGEEEEEEEEEETVQSNDDQFVESNDKSREVNDEKSKNFSDIDLCETKQKNSFSAVRPSLTIDTSSLPVSHVNNEISSKRKHNFDCLFYLKSNKIRLIILSLIIIIAVVIIVVVLVKK